MTVPSTYPVNIYIDGNDVSSLAPYESLSFEDCRRSVSTFEMTIENPSFVPTKDMSVFIFNPDTGATVFTGYVVSVEESKRDNGITLDYRLECGDRKIRLLKSVVAYDSYTGLDTDILDNLLLNAYPDLSSIYDFSNAVNLASGLDLPVNDDSLLDLLDNLSGQAGADYSFTPAGTPDPVNITFDSGGWGTDLANLNDGVGYHRYNGAFPVLISAVASGGNPDNCVIWGDSNNGTITNGNTICLLEINLGGTFGVTQVSFDYYVQGTSNVQLTETVEGQTGAITGTGSWYNKVFTLSSDAQFVKVGFKATANLNLTLIALDLRIDNVIVTTNTSAPNTNPKDTLNWDSTPPPADFDFDIDLSGEYGNDFDLDIGGWDDYNAVIVTGASRDESIDWTYPASGYQKQINLEKQVKDLVVYKNTGSDVSPTWTAQTLGYWGVDDIGTKDVLYDAETAWLLFNTEPSNLGRSVRITGSIKVPIRVLVSNVPSGGVTYATTIHDPNATTADAAWNIGAKFLENQNAIRRLNFTTMHTGLKVGQSIGVVDSTRGLDESTIIQKIRTKWIGASGHAKFEVECGIDEDNDAGGLIASNDKRSRDKAVPVPIGTITYEALLDSDGSVLTDSDGSVLYGSSS